MSYPNKTQEWLSSSKKTRYWTKKTKKRFWIWRKPFKEWSNNWKIASKSLASLMLNRTKKKNRWKALKTRNSSLKYLKNQKILRKKDSQKTRQMGMRKVKEWFRITKMMKTYLNLRQGPTTEIELEWGGGQLLTLIWERWPTFPTLIPYLSLKKILLSLGSIILALLPTKKFPCCLR